MQKLTVLALSSLVAVLLATACSTGGSGDAGPEEDHPALELTGVSADGSDVFANNCAGCHGADGDSGSAANLSEKVPELSDNDIAWTVADGKGNMPAINIDDQAIADVITFLRDTHGN
jgi:cytochrome c551